MLILHSFNIFLTVLKIFLYQVVCIIIMIILHNAIRTSCAFVRMRSGSLVADVRMRIWRFEISKREINKLWREYFPNCTPVLLGEQWILIK